MLHHLRLLTAGESHGPQITAIVDGLPAGVELDAERIAAGMRRRQVGYGRGNRMKIENDAVEVRSGVRFGRTTGAPITLVVPNRDHENWAHVLAAFGDPPSERQRRVTRPRPGHADLVGMLKYEHDDARDVLERASARETAARVAAGELARALLSELGIEAFSHVVSIGDVEASTGDLSPEQIRDRAETNDLRCVGSYDEMRAAIDAAGGAGDTLGGVFEVVVTGMPVGLGTSMAPDRKLDAQLAFALMSVPAVKGCEIGPAFENATRRGSDVHDEIVPRGDELPGRSSNRAGGLEGGMTTGEPLLCRGAMKPISTLKRALASVDMETGAVKKAAFERSDVCAVPAAGVIGEAVVMLTLADALLRTFAADTVGALRASLEERRTSYRERWSRTRHGE
ncbi:MAG TPA: chorismate synthase [Candidatus Krumholzibacteria bacterium]|nr:chorismate synthase [Candidatus Krumholzibacteria bacterium]